MVRDGIVEGRHALIDMNRRIIDLERLGNR